MLIVDVDEALTLMLTTTVTLILTPTIRRHTDARSVESRTGQLTDLVNSPTANF